MVTITITTPTIHVSLVGTVLKQKKKKNFTNAGGDGPEQ